MNEVRREQGAGAAADQPPNPTEPDESAEPAQAAADPRSDPPEPTEEERRAETEQWIKDQLAGRAAVSEVTAPKAEEPAAPEAGEDGSDSALRQAQGAEGAQAQGAEAPAEGTAGEGDSADAEGAEGESADAEAAEGESPDGEGAEGESADGEEAEAAEPVLPAYQRFDVTGTDPAALAEAAEAARIAIENGECVVLPTDTVYGIGADAFDTDAVQRLLDAKERGRDMPPPVLIGDASLIRALADEVPELVGPVTEKHWPGPLTVIVKARDSLRIDLGETRGTIGLRVPDYSLTRELLRQTGPMAVSSANLSGRPAALTCDEAIEYFGNKVAVYLDGGPVASPDGAPSSMVDFSQNDHGELLRGGALSVELLRETLPELADLTGPVEDPESTDPEPTDVTDPEPTDVTDPEPTDVTDPEPTDVGPAAEAEGTVEAEAATGPDAATGPATAGDSEPTGESEATGDPGSTVEDTQAGPTPDPEPAADEPDSSEDIERLIEQHAGEPVPADDAAPADDQGAADDHGAADDQGAADVQGAAEDQARADDHVGAPSEASPKT